MLYWLLLLLVLVPLVVEKRRLRQYRVKICAVVHVHGSRGKTSLTRNIAALLRANGCRVLAKTTGDAPELILPDGAHSPIRRIGPARIQEHARVLKLAAACEADVLVVEGMALQPETVAVSEAMLQASHAVISNVRPDHAETMGWGREGVIRTLSLLIPKGKTLFTAAEVGAEALCAHAARERCECVIVNSSALAQPVVLAEAVAQAVVKRIVPGLSQNLVAGPECGENTAFTVPTGAFVMNGIRLHWMDLFSANDVESSRLILEQWQPEQDHWASRSDTTRVALLAARVDRPLRTHAFMVWLLDEKRFDVVLPVGSHALYANFLAVRRREGKRLAFWASPLAGPKTALNRLLALAVERGTPNLRIACLGNTHGFGEKWRKLATALEENNAD